MNRKLRDSEAVGNNEVNMTSEEKTLLLGDSTLRGVKTSDLAVDTIVRTVSEANLNLLKQWVIDRLNFPLKKCVLYGGLDDLNDSGGNIVHVLDELGALVAELKVKNENMSINVCELIPDPYGDHDLIKNYNSKVSEWCSKNGITFIPTNLHFKLATGDIDTTCFKYDLKVAGVDNTRIGTTGLIDAISKKCVNFVSDDWSNIKHRTSTVDVEEQIGYSRTDGEN